MWNPRAHTDSPIPAQGWSILEESRREGWCAQSRAASQFRANHGVITVTCFSVGYPVASCSGSGHRATGVQWEDESPEIVAGAWYTFPGKLLYEIYLNHAQ